MACKDVRILKKVGQYSYEVFKKCLRLCWREQYTERRTESINRSWGRIQLDGTNEYAANKSAIERKQRILSSFYPISRFMLTKSVFSFSFKRLWAVNRSQNGIPKGVTKIFALYIILQSFSLSISSALKTWKIAYFRLWVWRCIIKVYDRMVLIEFK